MESVVLPGYALHALPADNYYNVSTPGQPDGSAEVGTPALAGCTQKCACQPQTRVFLMGQDVWSTCAWGVPASLHLCLDRTQVYRAATGFLDYHVTFHEIIRAPRKVRLRGSLDAVVII
jgi:hypothetical protein